MFWWSIPVQPRNRPYQLGNVGKHSGSLLHDCHLPYHCLCKTPVYEEVHIDSCVALPCSFSGVKTAKLVRAYWRLPKCFSWLCWTLDGNPVPLFLEHDLHRIVIVGFKKKCINVHCVSDFFLRKYNSCNSLGTYQILYWKTLLFCGQLMHKIFHWTCELLHHKRWKVMVAFMHWYVVPF